MSTMAPQITSLMVVYSTVYSDADQRKHQSSALLAFVWGIHRHKGPLTRKLFHLMTSSCNRCESSLFVGRRSKRYFPTSIVDKFDGAKRGNSLLFTETIVTAWPRFTQIISSPIVLTHSLVENSHEYDLQNMLSQSSTDGIIQSQQNAFERLLFLMGILNKGSRHCFSSNYDFTTTSYDDCLSDYLFSFIVEQYFVCDMCGVRSLASPIVFFISILWIMHHYKNW